MTVEWDERLRRRIGDPSQYARIDRFIEDDGPARGARRLRVVTGGGLEIDVHPDRGLDLGQVTIDGVPLAWSSPTRIASPWLVEPAGDGWVRTFGGGLLSTVGLDNFGPAGEENGQTLGTHGRIGAQPSELQIAGVGDGTLVVAGVIRQATAFGENLRIDRRIESPIGSRTFSVIDTVSNDGSLPTPWMLLYHINIGWPLLDDGTVLEVPTESVTPRDDVAAAGISGWAAVGEPDPEYREQVFQCVLRTGADEVAIRNDELGVVLRLRYSTDTLPWLNIWKLLRDRNYVIGIEPTNSPSFAGRKAAAAAEQLQVLAPGESVTMRLDFAVEGHPRRV